MGIFAQLLNNTKVGAPVVSGNLAMFPLHNKDARPVDYVRFGEAVEKELVTVTEVDEEGSVPTLLLDNCGAKPVFLLDGEQLIGAKQNRTVNLSLLIAAGAKTEIPVSCVEAGRWSRRSRHFHSSQSIHFARGRRAKMSQVNASLKRSGSRCANQGAVWDTIAEKRRKLGMTVMDAPTDAMEDMYDAARPHMRDYAEKIKPESDQLGAVFAVNGIIIGFDLFDSADHCAQFFQKLLDSHALDALETAGEESAPPEREKVEAFLKNFGNAEEDLHPAIGIGEDIRVETEEIVGAGLRWKDQYVHLAGFAKNGA